MTTLLRIIELEISYGAVRAVRGASLDIGVGELHAILGANGAGKSSIIRCIMGLVAPTSGLIELEGAGPIQNLKAHQVHELGVAWVPEGRQVFSNLSVEENLQMGAYRDGRSARLEEKMTACFDRFPILHERRAQLAGSLSGGEQQMLAISRALMSDPRLLLLDEPSLGLAPKIVRQLFELVREIADEGLTVLMAEQNARQALRVADYAHLLENGTIRRRGPSAEMAGHEDVRRTYLGG